MLNHYVDAHCHLADPRLSPILDEVVERSKKANIHAWIQGGVDPDDWDRQLRLKDRFGTGVVTCFGLHPWWVAKKTRLQIEEGLKCLEARVFEAQGVGELGLDFGIRNGLRATEELQLYAFGRQLEIARDAAKPIVLHIVKAHPEAIKCLKKKAPFSFGGLVHSFTGSRQLAEEYLSMGLLISVGGAVTREGFQTLKSGLRSLPLDRLVVETDSPDQLPVLEGISGESKLNEPANLIAIARAIGQLRGESKVECLRESAKNLKTLFKIED